MPAAYTSALSVQVLDFESFGPLIQRGCLLCGSCSSGQRFVSGFLQIPPHDGHPCLQLTVPPAGSVEDLACSAHAAPPGESPCRAQKKKPEHSSGDAASLSSSPLKGIGHTSLPMPATFIPSFSLPLMEIGNRQGVLRPRVRDRHRVSLPLMRIGTHDQALRPRLLILDLISPHGDRKLPSSMQSVCCTPSHYPSWGSETLHRRRLVDRGHRIISLPLMGIENTSDTISGSASNRNSLPLMGIGNTDAMDVRYATTADSLPLMGIGNGGSLDLLAHVERLITPHGDRKLPHRRASLHRRPPSLPLMGIGNSRP